MKKLCASTEFQYRENGKDYYKVFISRSNGTMVPGSMTLQSYTGKMLERVIKRAEQDIRRGAWEEKETSNG